MRAYLGRGRDIRSEKADPAEAAKPSDSYSARARSLDVITLSVRRCRSRSSNAWRMRCCMSARPYPWPRRSGAINTRQMWPLASGATISCTCPTRMPVERSAALQVRQPSLAAASSRYATICSRVSGQVNLSGPAQSTISASVRIHAWMRATSAPVTGSRSTRGGCWVCATVDVMGQAYAPNGCFRAPSCGPAIERSDTLAG